MKAINVTKYGSPEVLVLQEVTKPMPKDNEVLIKISAASITTADGMMRTGTPYIGRLFTGISKPKNAIPGTGFAGVVESIGKDVHLYKKGDEVFGENITTFGTNAEYVCVSESGVITIKPENISFDEAAPISDGALTSINFLKNLGNIKAGQKVLINGASGSLGTAAVQIAKYYGAQVTGVCSTTNMELVKSLGADKVIDYTKNDFASTGQIYDIIYDTVGKSSFTKSKSALSKNGVYLSPVLGASLLNDAICSSMFGKKKAKFSATGFLPVPKLKALLQELVEIIEEGKLRSVIDKKYSFKQIAQAHTYIGKGHKIGNAILTPTTVQ